MKISQKLVLVVAGLSLGACSSTGEKNTFLTYDELQNKVLSHDEQWQSVQERLDKIDALEAEVAALKQDKMVDSDSDSMMTDMDSKASSMESNETIMLVDETIPSDNMSSENMVTAAPLLSENTTSENGLVESDTTAGNGIATAPMANMSEEPINAASIAEAPIATKNKVADVKKYEYGVQVASYSNRDEAIRGWAVLNKKDPTSFKGLEPLVNQKDVNGRTMSQLKVGPFLSKSFSSDFCKMLKEKGKDCYVSQYNGDAFTAN